MRLLYSHSLLPVINAPSFLFIALPKLGIINWIASDRKIDFTDVSLNAGSVGEFSFPRWIKIHFLDINPAWN